MFISEVYLEIIQCYNWLQETIHCQLMAIRETPEKDTWPLN